MQSPYEEQCPFCGYLRSVGDDGFDVDDVQPVDACLCWPDEVECLSRDWDED